MRAVALAAGALFLGLAAAAPARGQSQQVDPESLMTTPVLLFNGGQEISQGTGFFYANMKPDGETAETVFLVTNYHVVTGHAPTVSAPRSGDHILFWMHTDPDHLERWQRIDLPLYDIHDDPVWSGSDRYPNADVVLIPLPAKVWTNVVSLFVFTENHTRSSIRIRAMSTATLLGYPYGFYDKTHMLPIWKTGHVASEPNVDFNGEPTFLVDVSAFPGMSGSPVLAIANGLYESEDGSMAQGNVLKLLGIFSAMPVVHENRPNASGYASEGQATTDISLQLGYVWKASVIVDIAQHYQPRLQP